MENLEESNSRVRNLKNQVDNVLAEVKNSKTPNLPYVRELDFTNVFFIIESAYEGENFQTLDTQYLINIEFGSNLIQEIEKRFDILDEEVRKFKIYKSNSSDNAETYFKQWYVNELSFLSNKLANLETAIERASVGTRILIEELK